MQTDTEHNTGEDVEDEAVDADTDEEEDGEEQDMDQDAEAGTDDGSVQTEDSVPGSSEPEDSDSDDETDDASVVEDKAATEDESTDPLEILVYPLPAQPDIVEKQTLVVEEDSEEEVDEDAIQTVSYKHLV